MHLDSWNGKESYMYQSWKELTLIERPKLGPFANIAQADCAHHLGSCIVGSIMPY